MMRIYISASGRLKEKYWTDACAEYAKRLGRYAKLTVSEAAEGTPPSVPDGCRVVALCPEGELLYSEEFAAMLSGWSVSGAGSVCFLIGDSNGLPEKLKARADFKLSLSRMTWPHHMARAMLLEQIYRAMTIIGGGKYHK